MSLSAEPTKLAEIGEKTSYKADRHCENMKGEREEGEGGVY